MEHIAKLVYNRTQADLAKLRGISSRGWDALTPDEREYWLRGEPVEMYASDARLSGTDGPLFCREGFLRGAYNAADLNRVEAAVGELRDYLTDLPDELLAYMSMLGVAPDRAFEVPYDVDELPKVTKTDWAMADIPTRAEMARYLGNVRRIAEAAPHPDAPELPGSMARLTWQGANSIERNLLLSETAGRVIEDGIKDKADRTAAGYVIYCGYIQGGINL